MKTFTLATLSMFASIGATRGEYPMRTECKINAQVAVVGKPVRIEVTATNQSGKELKLPPYVYLYGSKGAPKSTKDIQPDNRPSMGQQINFFKDDKSLKALMFRGSAGRLRVDPPFDDHVAPKEEKLYVFFWTPRSADIGKGFLYIDLPEDQFEPLKPIPLRITDKESKQGVSPNGP